MTWHAFHTSVKQALPGAGGEGVTGPRVPLVLLGALLPLAAGWQVVALLLPVPRGGSRTLKWSLGAALGLGFGACMRGLWRASGGTWPPPYLMGETAAFMFAIFVLSIVLKKAPLRAVFAPAPRALPRWTGWLASGAGLAAAGAVLIGNPGVLEAGLPNGPPVHPLSLAGLTLARWTAYSGPGDFPWPTVSALLTLAMTAGVLFGTLRLLASPVGAVVAVSLYAASTIVLGQGCLFGAGPLAGAMLAASAGCSALAVRARDRASAGLAAAFTALAAWTVPAPMPGLPAALWPSLLMGAFLLWPDRKTRKAVRG
jgi:hypothetical protein